MAPTPREITKCVYDMYKLTGKSPRIKDAREMPFTKNQVNKHFGTWNNMLACAGIPLNKSKISQIKCFLCSKVVPRQVKEIRKAKRHFCTSACSASYYTKGRKHSEETKIKISESLKAHRIFIV